MQDEQSSPKPLPVQITMYRRGNSTTLTKKKPPKKKQCNEKIVSFDVLAYDTIEQKWLNKFLKSVIISIDELNKSRLSLEHFFVQKQLPVPAGRSLAGQAIVPTQSQTTIFYVWTYLDVPCSIVDGITTSPLSIFNRLVPYDIFSVNSHVDDKTMKTILKYTGITSLQYRSLFEAHEYPIKNLYSIKCQQT